MLYGITRSLSAVSWGMAVPAPFLAMSADNFEKAMVWIGYGVIFALLSLVSAVAVHNER